MLSESQGCQVLRRTFSQAGYAIVERYPLALDGLELELRFLPGHSDCTSVVWIPQLATLCSADYLVSPGLPYCRFEARLFEEALQTLERWTLELGIERILPAHNDLIEGRANILAALHEERDYFQFLREKARELRPDAESREALVRTLARACTERRGVSLGGKERQDLDNARRVVAEEWREDVLTS